MKTLSQIALLAMIVATLTACSESGKGPSKPAATSSTVNSVN
ncbi:hypothetical protein LBMAG43_20080 [Methylococcaceae bacterium]|jgi:predicted small lipoprotein YifL|nr:hypothetical protein [Methylococcales bacterium]GDX85966.1 hypothetical protein LBMAG43_20080 [Methylococcaceae bacterium]